MISCNLQGGLGNMMFQIAAMKSFAKDNNSEVVFPNFGSNLLFLSSENFHNPNLKYAEEYSKAFKNLSINEGPINITKNISLPLCYVPLKFKDETNYVGFFQSEKFFIHNRDFILHMYEPNDIIKKYIESKYSNILKNKTCAIHVRRGDYLKLQDAHIVQNINYYNSAIKTIEDVDNYLIFSDDQEWCRANFIGDKFIFIAEEKDYVELFLISMCTHQIISNSSFGWWGAWLNRNENKKVVGPSKWFNEKFKFFNEMIVESDDIIPKNWIKI